MYCGLTKFHRESKRLLIIHLNVIYLKKNSGLRGKKETRKIAVFRKKKQARQGHSDESDYIV